MRPANFFSLRFRDRALILAGVSQAANVKAGYPLQDE